MEAYLGALRRVALFHGMGDRELLSMLDCLGARLRQYSKGDVIFHAGDPATHLGAVLTGQVQVSRTKADGQRVVMGEIRPGGLFAESFACARAESLPVTVTAAADAAVLLIDCGRISAPPPPPCTFHTRLISTCSRCWRRKTPLSGGQAGAPVRRTIRERLLSYLEEQAARTGPRAVTVPF
ncbi:MAG: cyclic nucleotide-binding domain-containing protein [Flavonifractor plautii]